MRGTALGLIAILVWMFSSGSGSVAADHPTQAPDQNVYTVTFTTDDQAKWGPGSATPDPLTLEILPLTTWDEEGGASFFYDTPSSVTIEGHEISIPSGTFGGAIHGSTTGSIALGMEFKDFGAGSVGVTYPIEATLTTPAANSFNLGDTINIDSSFRVLPGAELTTESPDAGTVSLNGTLGFTFAIDEAEACIFSCLDFLSTIGTPVGGKVGFGIDPPFNGDILSIEIPEEIPLDSYELAEAIIDGLPDEAEDFLVSILGQTVFDTLASRGTSELALFLDNTKLGMLGGHIGLPDVETTSALSADGSTLTASGEHDFIELEIDLTGFISPIGLGFSIYPLCLGDFCASYSFDIAAVTATTTLTQEEDYELEARPRVMLQFPAGVNANWSIRDCVPGDLALDPFTTADPTNPTSTSVVIACSGFSNTVIFDLGSSVDIITPTSLPGGSMSVTPTFLLPSQMSNDTVTTLTEDIGMSVGEIALEVSEIPVLPPFEIIPEVCVPGFGCTPALDFPGFTSPEIDIEEGPIYDPTFAEISIEDDSIFDGNRAPWVLGGFNAPQPGAFSLDPNLPPVPTITGPTSLNEGQNGNWVGNAVDPEGSLDITYIWNYGDGISSTGVNANHRYVDNGVYNLQLFVADHQGATAVTTHIVTVGNLPPSVNAGANQTVNEGTPVNLGAVSNPFLGVNLVPNTDAEGGNIGTGGPIWPPITSSGFQKTRYGADANVQLDITDGHAYLLNTDATVTRWGISPLAAGGFGSHGGPGSELYSQISSRGQYGCGLLASDGSIDCWGFSPFIPNGSWTVSPPAGAFTAIDALGAVCGVRVDGIIECAGNDTQGQFSIYAADGGPVLDGTKFSDVEFGVWGGCGLQLNGSVSCWGNTFSSPQVPFGNPTGTFSSISMEVSRACGIRTGGTVNCWSDHPSVTLDASPFGTTDTFTQLSVGNNHMCAVRTDGIVRCEGENSRGQSSPYGGFTQGHPVPANLAGTTFNQVSVSNWYSCGLRTDGTISCWGLRPANATPPVGNIADLATTFGEPNSGLPKLDSTGPTDRGDYFYYGGGTTPTVGRIFIKLTQSPQIWPLINSGSIDYVLSAHLGGSGSQADGTTVEVIYHPWAPFSPNGFCGSGPPACLPLGSSVMGPVTAADRANQTGLLPVSTDGTIPPGTMWIEILVTMTGVDGSRNDGYMDNLSLVLFANLKANFTDPGVADTHTANVTWGDSTSGPGTVTQSSGTGTIDASHAYADNGGPYTVTLSVQDDDHALAGNGVGTDTFTVNVVNVAPVVTGVPAAYVHTQSSQQHVANFTDAGAADTHTATIDWGDSSSSAGTVSNGQVFGTHTYSGLSGSFPQDVTITVRVTDDDGGYHEIQSIATVFELQIQSVSGGADRTQVEGSAVSFSGAHGTVISPTNGPVPSPLAFTRSWDFGDGSSATSASANHTYVDDGVYIARYIVEARHNGTLVSRGEDPVLVTVSNALPVVTQFGGPAINEGSSISTTTWFSDVGIVDTHSAVISWGDGASEPGTIAAGTVTGSHTYADNGSYAITVCVTDDDGGTGCFTQNAAQSVLVNNVAPAATSIGASPNAAPGEGSEITLSAVFNDPGFDFGLAGTLENFTATLNWGDGNIEPVNSIAVLETPGSPGTQTSVTVQSSHVYIQEGAYTVTVCLTDDDLAQTCNNLVINVQNVVPVVTASGHTINENGLATVTGTIVDPGPLDSSVLTINWGDGGVPETFAFAPGPHFFSKTHQYLDDDPSGSASDTYAVTLSAVDDTLTGAGTASATVTVNNVSPSVTLSGDTIDENGVATVDGIVFDPGTLDPLDVTIAWGDGGTETFSLGIGVTTFSKTHQYLDDDPTGTFSDAYTVTVTVTDDDSGSGTGTTLVNVNNVAPVVDAGAFQTTIYESGFLTASGSFSDTGTLDILTGQVDYGEGDGFEPLTLTAGGTFTLSNQYSNIGVFTVTVEICDDDIECGTDTAQVTVLAGLPTVTLTGPDTVDEGDVPTYTAIITNPGSVITTDIVVWDCDGDGIFDDGTGLEQAAISTDCVFPDDVPGTVTVGVQVTNSVGSAAATSIDVTVNNVAPTILLTGAATVAEGSVYELTFGPVSDPGVDTVASYVVTWGDETSDTYGVVEAAAPVTHTYADGPWTRHISVGLVDEDDTHAGAGAKTITVNNVAPTIVLSGASTVAEGSGYILGLGSVVDPGTDTVSQYTIHWGDGTVEAMAPTLSALHTYIDGPSTPTITVDLLDEDGAFLSAGSKAITVDNVAPTVDAGPDQTVIVFDLISIGPGSFGDAGITDVHTAEVNWGDGTINPLSVTEPIGLLPGTFAGNHMYTGPGSFTVTVTVFDHDGGSEFDSLTITVRGSRSLIQRALDEGLLPHAGEGKHIDHAIKKLEKALENDRWIDEIHATDKHGKKIFSEVSRAAYEIEKALDTRPSARNAPLDTLTREWLEMALEDILIATELLAEIKMEEASALIALDPEKQDKVDHENEKSAHEFAKALEELAEGDNRSAIRQFGRAWDHAKHAFDHASKLPK